MGLRAKGILCAEIDVGDGTNVLGLHAFEMAKHTIRIDCKHFISNALEERNEYTHIDT